MCKILGKSRDSWLIHKYSNVTNLWVANAVVLYGGDKESPFPIDELTRVLELRKYHTKETPLENQIKEILEECEIEEISDMFNRMGFEWYLSPEEPPLRVPTIHQITDKIEVLLKEVWVKDENPFTSTVSLSTGRIKVERKITEGIKHLTMYIIPFSWSINNDDSILEEYDE